MNWTPSCIFLGVTARDLDSVTMWISSWELIKVICKWGNFDMLGFIRYMQLVGWVYEPTNVS